ncbi:3-phenylpropionate/cinnamic acid dioxygenase subunit beta [Novosphingobium sp. KN65.2]|uniref:3-phenylpropionate/cinnamic acid dioxygenase subunit beta n=1 Tax=Novosphingobium sp. KN65.2 TaxID=1478134 RepID=UPI0005E3EE54|nr:3-phenylpropionate/cinnamic acid dioxygenase subunit beta [Novosphingobium sp. KN65.2]CDO35243.1 Biphenyl dioxygenase subunit beta [Novosphingobium sp. KN65.2]
MGDLGEREKPAAVSSMAAAVLQHEVEQFLYHEAALLDDRKHWEWYELLAQDLEYWMPARSTRARGDEANEFAPPGGGAFFDENKALIAERLRKLDTPYSWSEDPPSRTRHYVSNVRVGAQRDNGELEVHVNFLIYRSRLARDEDLWAGKREDVLRRVGDTFQIVKRHIYIDQVSLNSKNLSIFF